jgi:hypothetical protein
MKERDHLKELGVDGMTVLKYYILKKEAVHWVDRRMIVTTGGAFGHGNDS